MFTPPHNEPIINDRIARYKVEGNIGYDIGRLDLDLAIKAWGLNKWQRGIGSGWKSWQNTDWGLEKIRLDCTMGLGIRVWLGFQLYVEGTKARYIYGDQPKNYPDKYWLMTGVRWVYAKH